jgi:YD repeat-containing protein
MRRVLQSAPPLILAAAVLGAPSPAAALDQPSAGAATAQSIKVPDGPASVRGLASPAEIDMFTGQVGYHVPLEVPAGPGGMAPHLDLRYSGDLGNGPVGIGWTLDCPMIRRSERRGVPAYDATDELDLVGVGGGGRLVRDPVLTNPQQYWVEGRGTSVKVIQRNGHFEVTDSSGIRYFLGMSSASREEQGSQTASWMVDWIVDLASNEIDYTYTKASNRLYLSNIAWGPVQGGTPVFAVQIDYEARPDVVVSYRSGFPISTASRITAVRVRSFSHTLRTYKLSYDQSFALSRLRQVDLTGLDDSGSLPSTSFTYGAVQQPQMISFAAADGWTLNQRGVMAFDVDGDGMSDLLRLEMGNHEYIQGRGNYFGAPRPINGASGIDLESSALIDLDGDARPELVQIVDDTWRAYSLQDQSWVSMGQWPGTQGIALHAPDVALVDLNGDGRVDVVRPRGSGITVNFGGATGLGPGIAQPALSAADVAVQPGAPDVRFVDMNGDGLADVVWLTDAWMKVFLGRGDGTFVPFSRTPYPWGTAALQLSQILLADLNRDGLIDLVRVDDGNVTWYRGESDARFSVFFRHLARPESVDGDAVVTVADLNGNGSQDVVWSSPRGLWALDLAGATSAGMLTRIDNGLGMITSFTYDSSAVLAVAADRAGSPWEVRLPVSVPVPVTVDTDPGAGSLHRVVQQMVRDGFWDGVERRFGGFLIGRKISVGATAAASQVEETRFLAGTGPQRVLRGKPWYAQTLSGTGTIYTVATSEWAATPVTGLPLSPLTNKAALLVSHLFKYEGVSIPLELRTTYEFDGEVRAIVDHYQGRVDVTGDEKVVRRTYASDDTTWVRDRLTSEQTEEASGTVVASTRNFYGSVTGTPLALGQVGRGYLRQTDGFLAQESRWITQTARDYDACGNLKTNNAGGVTRTLTYDTRCLRVLTESVTPVAGTTLTWTATWDDVRGLPSTVQDPNSDITQLGYDTVSRISTLALNSAPAHIHYDYNWAAPRPSTTAWSFDARVSTLASSTWPTGAGWRGAVTYTNGAGESLFSSTALASNNYILSGWTERDERGRTVLTAEPFFVTSPAIGVMRPSTARVQTLAYDPLSRLATQTDSNGALTRMTYTAFGQTTSAAELADVISTVDGLGRVVHTERTVGLLESVDATYDAADRLLTSTLQKGLAAQVAYTYTYDTLGRLRTANDPDTGTRTEAYNDFNQLTQETNGAGENTYFEYDGAGRLTRRGVTPTAVAATDYRYVYDAAASALSGTCHVGGRLAEVFEPSGQVQFCYDAFGRRTALGRTVVPASGSSVTGRDDQEFSPSGLPLVVTADDGFAISYDYDRAARVIAIRNTSAATGGTVLWSSQTNGIDAAGRVTAETYGNGDTETYAYDTLGLASDVRIKNGAATDLYHITATRNSYGAPKTVTDALHPALTTGLNHAATYTYDLGGRLTDATMGPTGTSQMQFTYRYDALQNMTFRQACTGTALGPVVGVLNYGGTGHGPRQLISVATGSVP